MERIIFIMVLISPTIVTITGIQIITRDSISHLEIQVLVIREGVMEAGAGATKKRNLT